MAAEPERDYPLTAGPKDRRRSLSPRAAAFYDAVWDSARRGCLNLLRQCGASESEAEEIFAEVFANVMARVDPIGRAFAEPQMVNLLKVSCRRRLIDERRHRAVISELTLTVVESITDSHEEGPDELVERSEAIEVGKEAVLSLSQRDQTVFRLRYQLGLSPDEILERLPELSERSYRKRIERANRRVLAAYERIDRGERCEEIERGLLSRFVSRAADEQELVAVEAHLRHCRSCQLTCVRMRDHLQDVGSTLALVSGGGTLSAGASEATADAVGQVESLETATRSLRERARELVLKLPGVSSGTSGEATVGQAFGVASGKVVAACLGGVAATTCTVALVAPGLGPILEQGSDRSRGPDHPADARPAQASELMTPSVGQGASTQRRSERADGGAIAEPAFKAARERRAWSSARGPAPKPRSKVIYSPQDTGTELGGEADGTGSPVSPAEIEAATGASSAPSASSAGGSSGGRGASSGSTSGGSSPEFGM